MNWRLASYVPSMIALLMGSTVHNWTLFFQVYVYIYIYIYYKTQCKMALRQGGIKYEAVNKRLSEQRSVAIFYSSKFRIYTSSRACKSWSNCYDSIENGNFVLCSLDILGPPDNSIAFGNNADPRSDIGHRFKNRLLQWMLKTDLLLLTQIFREFAS